ENVVGVEAHPCRAVGLLQIASARQWCAAVEDTNVVKPEKPAFVQVVAGAVLAVRPPAEVPRQLAKDSPQKLEIAGPAQRLFHAVEKDRGPTMHRWIDVAKVPLIGWDLAGWVLVGPSEQEVELLL